LPHLAASEAQAAWLCDASATAKHDVISVPKRSKGTQKEVPNLPSQTPQKLRLFSFLRVFASKRAKHKLLCSESLEQATSHRPVAATAIAGATL